MIVDNLYLKDAPYASAEYLNNTNNSPYGAYTANGLGPWPSVQTEPNTTVRQTTYDIGCQDLSIPITKCGRADNRRPDSLHCAAPVDERDIDVLLDGGLFELLKCVPRIPGTRPVNTKDLQCQRSGSDDCVRRPTSVVHADFQAKVVFALEQLFPTSVVEVQGDIVTLRGNLTLPLPVSYASNGSGALCRHASSTLCAGPTGPALFSLQPRSSLCARS